MIMAGILQRCPPSFLLRIPLPSSMSVTVGSLCLQTITTFFAKGHGKKLISHIRKGRNQKINLSLPCIPVPQDVAELFHARGKTPEAALQPRKGHWESG